MPLEAGQFSFQPNPIYFVSAEIDGTVTGDHEVGTTKDDDSNELFHVLGCLAVTTEAANIILPAAVSCGTNATSYNNICLNMTIGGIGTAIKAFSLAGNAGVLAEGSQIRAKVNIAATGISVVHKFRIVGFGFYR